MTHGRWSLLRRALQANALFSGLSGVALILAAGWLSGHLGLQRTWILPVLGVGLIGFAGSLLPIARAEPIDRVAATGASVADGLWVMGSLVLGWWDPLGMTAVGLWLVIGVAGIVLLFALAQAWGLARSRRQTPPAG